jgi:hypothetical protein
MVLWSLDEEKQAVLIERCTVREAAAENDIDGGVCGYEGTLTD